MSHCQYLAFLAGAGHHGRVDPTYFTPFPVIDRFALPLSLPLLQVLAIMDESIQVYSPELLQNRIAILR